MATTIEQLKAAKSTWEFKAPPFANGTELVVELRQPSIMAMIYEDGVANPLINDVQAVADQVKKKKTQSTPEQQASAYRLITKVVEYCMVSPTYKEVNEYVGMTDSQLLAIYQEVMKSTTDLSSFRPETTNS
jgi:hypothetical protein